LRGKIGAISGYRSAIRHILEDVIEIGDSRDETRVKICKIQSLYNAIFWGFSDFLKYILVLGKV
jgi:hypothetical protein